MKRLLPVGLMMLMGGCGSGGPPPGPVPPGPTPNVPVRVETFVPAANFPVSLAFAPDGRLFYTEKNTGNIRIVQGGTLLAPAFATVQVVNSGEQGLLGLAFDPNFAANAFVYVYHTFPGPPVRNRVVRFTAIGNLGAAETVIVDNLPANSNHNGGRIAFGPDGMLYVTLGDSGNPANAQDSTSPAGKLLRYNRDGTLPAGNPVAGQPMFALGLRNSFGLTFHRVTGTPYVSDNGPNCDDEVNRIVSGGNYGWRPSYPCGDTAAQFRAPIVRFTPPIAPTGLVFYAGSVFPEWANHLFLADFNSGSLRRFRVDDTQNGLVDEQQVIVNGGFGAMIDVTVGPDGNLYVATDGSILRIVRGP